MKSCSTLYQSEYTYKMEPRTLGDITKLKNIQKKVTQKLGHMH